MASPDPVGTPEQVAPPCVGTPDHKAFPELSAPSGWQKKIGSSKKGSAPSKRDVYFVAPDGEEIKNKRALDRYLKSHPGGPTASEFDWSTGETPTRRSSRLSTRTRPSLDSPKGASAEKRRKKTKEDEHPKSEDQPKDGEKGELEQPAAEASMEKADEVMENLEADEVKLVEETGVKPAEETGVKPALQPAEETGVKPVEEAGEKPVEETVVKPAEEAEVKPVEEAEVKPVEEAEVKPMEEVEVKPMEEAEVKPVEEVEIKSVEEVEVKPVEVPQGPSNGEGAESKVEAEAEKPSEAVVVEAMQVGEDQKLEASTVNGVEANEAAKESVHSHEGSAPSQKEDTAEHKEGSDKISNVFQQCPEAPNASRQVDVST